MRGESEASAAVLETKRLFVRFISHEVCTPLNAVHLGLEALTTELSNLIDKLCCSPLHRDTEHLWSMLDGMLLNWLVVRSVCRDDEQ